MKFKYCDSLKDYFKKIGYKLNINILEYHFNDSIIHIIYNDLKNRSRNSIQIEATVISNSIDTPNEKSLLLQYFTEEEINEWERDSNLYFMKLLQLCDNLSCTIRYEECNFDRMIEIIKEKIVKNRNKNKGDDLKMKIKNMDMNNDNGVGLVYGGTTTVNNTAGMNMSIPNLNTVTMACNGNDMVNTSNLAMNGMMGGMMGGMMNTINFYSTDNQEAVVFSQRFHIDFMTSKHILHLIKNYIATSTFKCNALIELLELNKGSLVARTRIYQKETESTREIIQLKSNENFISEYKNKIEGLNIEYNSLLEIQNKICRALESLRENSDSIGLTIFSDILTIVYKLNDPNLNDFLIDYSSTHNKLFLDRINTEDNHEVPRHTRSVATNYYQANK